MPPTLLHQFKKACNAFNAARTVGRYDDLAQYLYTTVFWHYVNDPDVLRGNPADIIDYLNTTQARQSPNDLYPVFDHGGYPRTHHHQNENGVPIGNVTGIGSYQDDYKDNTNIITVQYVFRFRQVGGNWLLANASATPI
jgi:hypothetical protein